MMEFGKSLRTAREARGYTVQQLAESTRMAPAMINDLEADDFSHIAAPIYGRGFVKLYCEAVGLEPKPFIDEFMELVNGNRTPRIKELSAPPAVEEPAEPTPAPTAIESAPEQPEPTPQRDLFSEPLPQPEQAENALSGFLDHEEPSLSRYATPFRNVRDVSPAIWRIGALALGALIVLTLLILGLRALHHATAPDTVPAAAETELAEPEVKPTAPKAATTTPRAQQKIPGLYID